MKESRHRRFVFSLVTLAVTATTLSWSLSPGAAQIGYRERQAGPIVESTSLLRPLMPMHQVRAIAYCTSCHGG
jgi:hypothetical protein